MALENELKLRKPIKLLSHEALLNIYHTTSCLKKHGVELLKPFGLTDVQFNLMMLLYYQSDSEPGLSQATLSDMMLVNRANITTLIDRMEKAGLVVRTQAPADRRSNIVKLTTKGKKLLEKVEPMYAAKVKNIMTVLKKDEQSGLIKSLEKIRSKLSE